MPDLNRSLLSEGENADTLGGLTDVSITTPEEFQSLVYNGTGWVNGYAPLVSYVQNAEANTLTTGTVVYLFGGTGDHASVKRADYSSDTTSSKTIGVVGANIAASQNGPVVTRGYIDGIDLSVGYSVGDVLWLGDDGQFTTTKATAPNHLVFIGVVVRASNNGIIYVATQNGYELDEIHNVALANVAAGDFLKYNGSLWINDAINLGTDTVGDYVGSVAAGTGVNVSNTATEGGTFTVGLANTAVTAATYGSANTVATFTVDAQGRLTNAANTTISIASSAVTDFTEAAQDAAGELISNGSQSGIAVTYDDANARINFDVNDFTITLGGDLTGNVTISNLGNATLNASVAANSVELGTDTAGNYVGSVSAGTGVNVSNTGAEGGTFTVGLANTAVTAATYGAANTVGTFTVDAQGRLTNAANATIAITSSQVTDFSTSAVTSLTGTSNQVAVSASNGAVTISLPSNVTIPNNLIVTGDLTVSGNTTTLNTANLNVEDNFVVLNSGVTGTPSLNGGIEIERGDSTNVLLRWNESNDKWEITFDGSTYHQIATNTDVAGVTITSLDNISDVIISNTVASGDFLKWNGTAWVNDPIDLGTDTTGNYMSNVSGGSLITVTHTPSEGSTATVALSNGSAGQIILANSTGVPTYTTVSGDITIASNGVVSIAANSVALGTDTTGNYVADVTAGTGISVSHTPGEGSSANISLNANIADLSDVNSNAPGSGDVLTWNGSSWGPAVPTGGGAAQTNTTITTNSITTIATFDKTTADSAEFTVKVVQGDRRLSTKALALHNGTDVDMTAYGEISIPGVGPVIPQTGLTTWTERQSNFFSEDDIRSINYQNNIWLITGGGGGNAGLATSTDAITWAYTSLGSSGFFGLTSSTYAKNIWVVAGGYGLIATSTNAITWVTRASGLPFTFGSDITRLAFGNDLWVAGTFDGQLRTSTDAITWVTRTSNFGTSAIFSLAFGNNLWVAVGYSGQMRVSTDTITWVTRTSNFGTSTIRSIAFADNLWVAGGDNGNIRTSTDAVTWVTRTSNIGGGGIHIRTIAYGNGLWVAGAYTGQLRTSTDAITWVTRQIPSTFTDNLLDPTTITSAHFGNNLWVVGSQLAQIATSSPDFSQISASVTLSADISGSNVRLRATIPDAATTNATVSVLQTNL